MNGVYFKELPDPRQAGKVIYPLAEVLLLCLLAVLAGAESFVDIARFGEKKIEFLRRFRPFHHGTPAHDHLGDIFALEPGHVMDRGVGSGLDAAVVAVDGLMAADFCILEAIGLLFGGEQFHPIPLAAEGCGVITLAGIGE